MRMEGVGGFSSWVTAFRKLPCCSFRRISRTRKTVFTDKPPIISPKKMMPKTSGTTRRQLITIQLTLSTIVNATRKTPSVIKNAIDFVRLEMRIGPSAQIIVAKGLRHHCLRRVGLAASVRQTERRPGHDQSP